VAALGLDLTLHGYTPERAATFLRQLRERAAALPGVSSAALATRVPFDVNVQYDNLFPDTARIPAGKPGVGIDMTAVDPGYLETVGVRLLRGRDFDSHDVEGAPAVAIVNLAMARRYWGSADGALGHTFRRGREESSAVTVIGVVADHAVRAVGEEPRPFVHYPLAQRPSKSAYLLARSATPDAAGLVEPLRRLALALDPDVAVTNASTLAAFQSISLYPVRMGATLLGAFACLALALANVGLYGVIAYAVGRRQREMGIRMAVGAERRTLVALVVGRGMRLVGSGVLVGGALAAAGTRLLSAVLHGVSALDPLSFAAAAAVLALAGWVANVVPARRAARVDPVVVLRGE
jgi:putative ABC transport system permease protein